MNDTIHSASRRIGPYICIKMMGSGGQSSVFSAMHEVTGRMVALRIMTVTAKDGASAVQACDSILDDLMHLDAPHVVPVEDYGVDHGALYIAMPIMYGGSLMDRMQYWSIDGNPAAARRLPSPADVLGLFQRIAQALDDIHAKGFVHGQIGPRSIMFDDKGQAYLADVGLTRLMKVIYKLDATNSFNMTKYSAPELWEGYRPDPASDQYALGCLIYELLTGKATFDAPSIYGLMQAHTNHVATPPHAIRQELPQGLAMVFWQALAKPTRRRFPDVTSFYDALARQFNGKTGTHTNFFTFALDKV